MRLVAVDFDPNKLLTRSYQTNNQISIISLLIKLFIFNFTHQFFPVHFSCITYFDFGPYCKLTQILRNTNNYSVVKFI